MTNIFDQADHEYKSARDAFLDKAMDHPHWIVGAEIGSGEWWRECRYCGHVASFRNWSDIDLDERCSCRDDIPFNGELCGDDAPESVPKCYGL